MKISFQIAEREDFIKKTCKSSAIKLALIAEVQPFLSKDLERFVNKSYVCAIPK